MSQFVFNFGKWVRWDDARYLCNRCGRTFPLGFAHDTANRRKCR